MCANSYSSLTVEKAMLKYIRNIISRHNNMYYRNREKRAYIDVCPESNTTNSPMYAFYNKSHFRVNPYQLWLNAQKAKCYQPQATPLSNC